MDKKPYIKKIVKKYVITPDKSTFPLVKCLCSVVSDELHNALFNWFANIPKFVGLSSLHGLDDVSTGARPSE
jgi:hypothetical protein